MDSLLPADRPLFSQWEELRPEITSLEKELKHLADTIQDNRKEIEKNPLLYLPATIEEQIKELATVSYKPLRDTIATLRSRKESGQMALRERIEADTGPLKKSSIHRFAISLLGQEKNARLPQEKVTIDQVRLSIAEQEEKLRRLDKQYQAGTNVFQAQKATLEATWKKVKESHFRLGEEASKWKQFSTGGGRSSWNLWAKRINPLDAYLDEEVKEEN